MKLVTYLKNFFINRDVQWGYVVLVLGHELRVLQEEQLEAVSVPVLRAEVARGVAVAVLGIHVRSLLQKRVDHVVVATNAGHVQWRAHCLGPAVQVTPVLGEDLDQVDVPLI